MSKPKPKPKAKHSERNREVAASHADREVVARLGRLIKRAPKPRRNEDPFKWGRRFTAYQREWRSFVREQRSRLLRLGIDTNEIEVVGIEPIDDGHRMDLSDVPDPRHEAAEEKEVLEKLARKGVRFERLG